MSEVSSSLKYSLSLIPNNIAIFSVHTHLPLKKADLTSTILQFPGDSVSKESACNLGDLGLIPRSGRSPGEGNDNPLQYSCLGNPLDRAAWWASPHGVARVRQEHGLATKPLPPILQFWWCFQGTPLWTFRLRFWSDLLWNWHFPSSSIPHQGMLSKMKLEMQLQDCWDYSLLPGTSHGPFPVSW